MNYLEMLDELIAKSHKGCGTFLFVAIHKGPYLSLLPLESSLKGNNVIYLVEGVAKEERSSLGLLFFDLDIVEQTWGDLAGFIRYLNPNAVIRGCSEDVIGPNIESMSSEICNVLDIPLFAVEDFPGNYQNNSNFRLDGLFVEHQSVSELHVRKGIHPSVIHVAGNPRYNAFADIQVNVLRKHMRTKLNLKESTTVLWAGQPDGNNSFLSLERTLIRLQDTRVVLLFRAHPRDELYRTGLYTRLFQKALVRVKDVSSVPDIIGLYCASDLVATQFSSAAVEASHLGIPALYVLFDDLAKKYLRKAKGYNKPIWADGYSSFVIEDIDESIMTISEALFNNRSRVKKINNFNKNFGKDLENVSEIISHIKSAIGLGYRE